jgi:hypothetical protein
VSPTPFTENSRSSEPWPPPSPLPIRTAHIFEKGVEHRQDRSLPLHLRSTFNPSLSHFHRNFRFPLSAFYYICVSS